ncbi:MAG: ATP-binding protein [Planctomycetota bacterium]
MNSQTQIDQALLTQLAAWLESQEDERFEFKEAKCNYDFEKLSRYVCAIANEGGGKVVLGVTDKRPRQVVGSQAFLQLEQLRKDLMEKLPLRLDVLEVRHPNGRVVVVDVPGRPVGMPMKVDGRYWARKADSLVTLP